VVYQTHHGVVQLSPSFAIFIHLLEHSKVMMYQGVR